MFAQTSQGKNLNNAASSNQKYYGADFYNENVLPKGNWELTVVMGHAWVFCNNRNMPVHKGESIVISEEDGDVTVRALYTRGYAAYTALSAN